MMLSTSEFQKTHSDSVDYEKNETEAEAAMVSKSSSTYKSGEQNHPSNMATKTRPNLESLERFELGYTPVVGELSRENETFCAFQLVKKYPYTYIGKANMQRVDDGYFHSGRLYENCWELFYLHRNLLEGDMPPLVLVTTLQFNHFLARINRNLGTQLTIPSGSRAAFEVSFPDKSTPRPRYLGHIDNKLAYDRLVSQIPSWDFKLDGESEVSPDVTEKSVEDFARIVSLMLQNHRKKAANKAKVVQSRRDKIISWINTIKRVQRYLGIRPAKNISSIVDNFHHMAVDSKQKFLDSGLTDTQKSLATTTLFDSTTTAAFTQESSVIFFSVDVEAWERNSKVITEIGVAMLDTKDIQSLSPGEAGSNWMSAIRAHHYRIDEHRHYNNSSFVSGCADRFEFGKSEFVSIKDIAQVLSDRFRLSSSESGEKDLSTQPHHRKIVLVGHDINSDIKFLKTIGFDIYSLPNLLELVDTALMFRVLKREMNTRSLGSILMTLGIVGWNLHNAGNDAVYTLQAVIGLAIKYTEQQQQRMNIKNQESMDKTESTQAAEENWSSSGNEGDGGRPEIIVPPSRGGK